ncbi:MAG: putative lipopolysaccharide heptosyltransferase III [Betaproteobacteria bacterium]|nr:putative lipopolysaccharide heptosyltransferase III [Betaproteobacteria bacterium]
MAYGPSDAIDPREVRRALVVKLRHHGDVLLASPVFSVLKRAAPQAEIDALIYGETRDMLALHPAISRLFEIDRAWKSQPFARRAVAEWRLFRALRERRYDLIIHLSDHSRGAWLARSLGARCAVAPDYGNKPRWWRRSFTHWFPQAGRRHTVELNLDALRRIGIQPGADERALVLVPGEEARSRAEALLAENGLAEKSFIHLHPGSRWQFKCWPPERIAALMDELDRRGERLVLTGAPDKRELELIAEIRRRTRAPFVDLAGQTTLKTLAALAARARLFIGVDSAPMHIAAAMRTPVVALFGPSGEAEWRPWMTRHRVVVSAEHPCRPCGNDGCGGGKVSECLTNLALEPVLAAIDALLAP